MEKCPDCGIERSQCSHPLELREQEIQEGLEIMLIPEKGYLKYKEGSDYMELRSIFIKRDYRLQKLGYKLVSDLEEIGRNRNKKYIYIRASTDGESDPFGRFLKKVKYLPLEKPVGEFTFYKEL